MVVCLCACVSEADLIQEILKGYDTVAALSERLSVAKTCGSCLLDVQHLIDKYRVDYTPLPSLQFVKIVGTSK